MQSDTEPSLVGGPEPVPLSGRLVDDDAFAADAPLACPTLSHSFTLDRGGELGHVRVSWEREGLDLSVVLADGDVTVEQVSTNLWGHGSSFVVRDADGLALAVNGASSLDAVDDATFDWGGWRAESAIMCGTLSLTGILVTIDGVATDYSVGTPAGLSIGGADLTFYPLVAYRLGPDWHCTDSSDTLNWALVRPRS